MLQFIMYIPVKPSATYFKFKKVLRDEEGHFRDHAKRFYLFFQIFSPSNIIKRGSIP